MKKVLFVALGICICMFGIACSKTSEQQGAGAMQQSVSQAETSKEASQEGTKTQPKERLEESQHVEVDDKINELLEVGKNDADEDRYYLSEWKEDRYTRARIRSANAFIRERFPDYFTNKTLIEESIQKGYYVEILYSVNVGENDEDYMMMGQILCELAQKVYKGEVGLEDDYVKEQLNQLEEKLQLYYGTNYGKNSRKNAK